MLRLLGAVGVLEEALALPTLLSDINMLVMTGGRERTNAEYAQLLTAGGLRIGGARPVGFPYGVIEGYSSSKVFGETIDPVALPLRKDGQDSN